MHCTIAWKQDKKKRDVFFLDFQTHLIVRYLKHVVPDIVQSFPDEQIPPVVIAGHDDNILFTDPVRKLSQ
ncbi:hypothetical protein CCY01nite_43550 [Chitinophaga cymbidii]|uniref:Uncharacterized protein n=1 Tax=Chitinophaga cymbidii TaxID=1096750 RepID=A0A512RQX4_9BACT|nr:hypothetical protein CCY01nite_43550 [Chitinophaga cymbidii]